MIGNYKKGFNFDFCYFSTMTIHLFFEGSDLYNEDNTSFRLD